MAPRKRLTTITGVALGAACMALVAGCDAGMAGGDAPAEAGAASDEQEAPETVRVRLGDETFRLELALDPEKRTLGLGGREEIARDGGMLFVFPQAAQLSFVMRDCPIPIDVAFLDGGGRVVAIHEMQPEEPRGEDEGFWEYENRLRRYSSRFASQIVVETAGGRLAEVGLKVGDLVPIDTEALKERAR
jgi:uncharacterized membrane protein (UPF0127 family)